MDKNITIAGAKAKNWGLPIKAGQDVISCVWLCPVQGSVPCKEYNYYPDLAESLPVDATSPGESKPNGERIKRNPWVFIEVEKLLGSRTMGLEITGGRTRTDGRNRGIQTYNIDDETLAALTEAGDDFERIHEVGGEVQGAV